MRKIYQAGPLFSDAERSWHGKLSERLRAAGHSVVWPGDLLTSDQIKAAGPGAIALIFETCRNAIDCIPALSPCLTALRLMTARLGKAGTPTPRGFLSLVSAPTFDKAGIRSLTT